MMKLSEVTGEFERVRAITYNSKGDKAVYHYRMMRCVVNNIYSGIEEADEYGNVYMSIYVKYPGVDAALYVDKLNAWRDVQTVAEVVNSHMYYTKECFVVGIKKRIKNEEHIRLTEIEMLKYIAPELEPAALESRRICAEKREEKAAKRREEWETEKAAYVERENMAASDVVRQAVLALKNGGTVENKKVTFYKDRYDYKTHSLINYLMDANGIVLPIRTRGWIKENLKNVSVGKDGSISWTFMKTGNGKGSSSFSGYMAKLILAARAA